MALMLGSALLLALLLVWGPRTVLAEDQADGSIIIPEALRPFMGVEAIK